MTSKSNLESEVRKIFASSWEIRERKGVPTSKDLSPDNDAIQKNATFLYADMADSTVLVNKHPRDFAAKIYKSYLRCAATIINNAGGTIRSYDGDRVMAVFLNDQKNDIAVRCAMSINRAIHNIINPLLKEYYPKKKYQLKHVIGIDSSEILVTRIGVRKDSDLVWVGNAANYAAKLCSLNGEDSIYITRSVFKSLTNETKYGGKGNILMWHKYTWKEQDNRIIYGSNLAVEVN
jgi:class 3 adenylate cyclase